MKRKLTNWIDTFYEYVLPRVEAPESYITWGGLYTLAAALRRHVKVGREFLGGWECYPHLFVLFVGPAGLGKTTTVRFGQGLLKQIETIPQAPTITTQAALQTALASNADGTLYIIAEEFGDFIMKSKTEMFEWLTSIYDGKDILKSLTISRGGEEVKNPCVNLFGATTPQWIAENMPASIIGGGFARRVVMVYEEESRTRRMYYRGDSHNESKYAKLKEELVHDLRYIADNLFGSFKITEGQDIYQGDNAIQFMEEWYQDNFAGDTDDPRMAGYFRSKPSFIHKVAMLLRVSEQDCEGEEDLVLTSNHFKKAIEYIEHIEPGIPKALRSVGAHDAEPTETAMLFYVTEKGSATIPELKRKFKYTAKPSLLQELIEGLLASQFLEFDKVLRILKPTEHAYKILNFKVPEV